MPKIHPDIPTHFAVVPRRCGTQDIRWFEADPTYVLHWINTFEDSDWLVLDGSFHHEPMPAKREGTPKPLSLYRWLDIDQPRPATDPAAPLALQPGHRRDEGRIADRPDLPGQTRPRPGGSRVRSVGRLRLHRIRLQNREGDALADRVLVVEDDETVRTLLRMLLEDEGFAVTEASTGLQATERFDRSPFELVLLDLRLPGMNGFDVCRHIRRHSEVPIIMVTAQQDSHDIVAGLELGADDYVTKPFNDRELLARIRVQLRRKGGTGTGERLTTGPLEVLPDEGTVRLDGVPVSLTRTEFQLLCHFSRHPNRVWSRDQLLQQIWGYEHTGDGRVVDTHVARLRVKIETDPANPQLIQTVRGLGYKMPRDTT